MILDNIFDAIGHTPIVKIKVDNPCCADIYAKLEFFNPGGSVKDRVAKNMLLDLIEQGKINENTVLVEPTSGNTGIGIAMLCASLSIKFIATMPETMSEERKKLLRAYGAEIVLTEGKLGMNGAIQKAEELSANPNTYILSQFSNPKNPQAHEKSTALEIIEDFDTLDAFVSGIGTGGTITGCAKVLKAHFNDIEVIGVEPLSSPFLSKGEKGAHKIQGIGAGFKPEVLQTELVDTIIAVSDDDAFAFARRCGVENGILLGISGGAAFKAAYETALKLGPTKKVLFIAPDNGERYLSTTLYEEG